MVQREMLETAMHSGILNLASMMFQRKHCRSPWRINRIIVKSKNRFVSTGRRRAEEGIPLLNLGDLGRTEVLCSWSKRVEHCDDEISLQALCESEFDCFHRCTRDKQVSCETSEVLSFRIANIVATK
jgi:hypothetical protein